jgi:hypothetical protein
MVFSEGDRVVHWLQEGFCFGLGLSDYLATSVL